MNPTKFHVAKRVEEPHLQLGLAILLICVCGSMVCASDLPPLEIIRASYVETVTSVHTFQYDMEEKWVQAKQPPPNIIPPDADMDMVVETTRRHVWRDGRKVALSESCSTQSGNNTGKSWVGFNGTTFGQWSHSVTSDPGREQLPQGFVSETPLVEIKEITIGRLLGLDVNGSEETLEKLLKRPDCRVTGVEPVGRASCIKVEWIPDSASPKTETFKPMIVWFDPAVGYLPRQIRVIHTESFVDYEVFDFQEVVTRGKKKIHLPLKAVWRTGYGWRERHFTFLNVVLNESIPAKVFNPVFPLGTYVRESLPGEEVRFYFAGGDAGARHYLELQKAHLDATKLAASQRQSAYSAMGGQVRGLWWRWLGGLVGVVLFAYTVKVFLRKPALDA